MTPELAISRKPLFDHALKYSAILMSVVALATGMLFALAMRSVALASIEKESLVLGSAFAKQTEFPMLVGDEPGMKATASQFLAVKDVLFVVVTDFRGKTLRLARPGFPMERLTADSPSHPVPTAHRQTSSGSFDYVESTVPVEGPNPLSDWRAWAKDMSNQPIGTVQLAVSIAEPKIAAVKAALAALACTVLCLLLAVWLQGKKLRHLLAPLHGSIGIPFATGASSRRIPRARRSPGCLHVRIRRRKSAAARHGGRRHRDRLARGVIQPYAGPAGGDAGLQRSCRARG